MATQRITLAKVAGEGGRSIHRLARGWSEAVTENGHSPGVRQAIDGFVLRLKAQSDALAVVYYCEWIDRWSMGDDFPGRFSVAGDQFEITCLSSEEALLAAKECRHQFQEQQWLASRLRECASSWNPLVETSVIILIREVLGPSASDEINHSQAEAPAWIINENIHA
ncbi:hypothetical protein ACXR0O_23550 [Verrucomicrobiota bacterium sgz303538]